MKNTIINKLEKTWDIGYAVINEQSEVIRSKNLHKTYETSSTIKSPLMHMFLAQMSKEKSNLDRVFAIHERHKSNGSGVASYTDWTSLTLHAIIDLTCVYSDCLTTNVIIEQVGGQDSVNNKLKKAGYSKTVLNKNLIKFSEPSIGIESVGTTTPADACHWMVDTITSPYIEPYLLSQFLASTRSIDMPWYSHPDPSSINLLIKTGSMIDTNETGQSVFNVIGSFMDGDSVNSFGFFSKGDLHNPEHLVDELSIKTQLSSYITDNVIQTQ